MMPRINIEKYDNWLTLERQILDDILTDNNTLKSNRPKKNGLSDYVWRMVAFHVSPEAKHHCLPVMAFYYLNLPYEEAIRVAKLLDEIVNRIVDTVPLEQHHGIHAWGSVLGSV